MKLIEFALDLPYIENEENVASIIDSKGCERNEATQIDYEMNWKWKRREFENETRCISSYFSRLLGEINTKDIEKILIECVPKMQGKIVRTALKVCAVQIQFDYGSFISFDGLGKKKSILETLMKGIKTIAEERKWDINPFESVYNKIVEAGYKNEWVWKKPVKSPDKKAVAHIFLQHEVKQIDIFFILRDNDGREIIREKIITETPNEWNYAQHLGEIKWLDNKKVALVNKNKDKEWIVSFKPL